MVLFESSTMARESTKEKVNAKKKRKGFPFFRNPVVPIPNPSICPSSPAARKPTSVAIPFDLLRKKEAMMQKVPLVMASEDGQDGEKERAILRSSFGSMYRGRVVRRAESMSIERKKK
jgi:hypothetical protein